MTYLIILLSIVIASLIVIIARKGLVVNNFKYIMLTEDKNFKNVIMTLRERKLWVAIYVTLLIIVLIQFYLIGVLA